ncbi:MAG: helix-turn-helix domain-containing protein [Paludibacteraceae bacterium]
MRDRLLAIRKKLGLKQEDFASALSITRAAYTMIETGKADLTSRNRRIIEEKFNIHPQYLAGADVSMFAEKETKKYQINFFIPDNMPRQIGKLHISPIYNSFPTSASLTGLSEKIDEKPSGYIYTTLLGAIFFPAIGCSFEPKIHAGEYIGVIRLNSWDTFDTEKIYYILTRNDRLIKHLHIDEYDKDIFWCLSPTFQKFKIHRKDIVEISHIFFHGEMI